MFLTRLRTTYVGLCTSPHPPGLSPASQVARGYCAGCLLGRELLSDIPVACTRAHTAPVSGYGEWAWEGGAGSPLRVELTMASSAIVFHSYERTPAAGGLPRFLGVK